MNGNNESVQPVYTGRVTQFDRCRRFGIVVTDSPINGRQSFSLSIRTGPRVVGQGLETPFFTGTNSEFMPVADRQNGDTIRFSLNDDHTVTNWCLERDWKAAEAQIAQDRDPNSSRSQAFMAQLQHGAAIRAALEAGRPVPVVPNPSKERCQIFSSACVA
jgi:hypothetical protein